MRVAAGESNAEIARGLGRHRSTIGRELARCGRRRGHYAPFAAERRARRLGCRVKPRKLAGCPRLLAEVEAGLRRRWSPRQISARLRVDHPGDEEMRISHETIYQSLFVQARGELRRQLTAELRTGRTARKPQGSREHRGRIVGMINISQRPAEAEDRAVPGHWEGDLILGTAGRSAVATLVERQTRYVMLCRLGNNRDTLSVIAALKDRIAGTAGASEAVADLGPGQRARRPPPIHDRVRRQRVLLRPALTVAARQQREHQRAAAPVPPQTQRPRRPRPSPARPDRRRAQRPPAKTLGWAKPAEKMLDLLNAPAQPPAYDHPGVVSAPPIKTS